jgi:hypothetical protein
MGSRISLGNAVSYRNVYVSSSGSTSMHANGLSVEILPLKAALNKSSYDIATLDLTRI